MGSKHLINTIWSETCESWNFLARGRTKELKRTNKILEHMNFDLYCQWLNVMQSWLEHYTFAANTPTKSNNCQQQRDEREPLLSYFGDHNLSAVNTEETWRIHYHCWGKNPAKINWLPKPLLVLLIYSSTSKEDTKAWINSLMSFCLPIWIGSYLLTWCRLPSAQWETNTKININMRYCSYLYPFDTVRWFGVPSLINKLINYYNVTYLPLNVCPCALTLGAKEVTFTNLVAHGTPSHLRRTRNYS